MSWSTGADRSSSYAWGWLFSVWMLTGIGVLTALLLATPATCLVLFLVGFGIGITVFLSRRLAEEEDPRKVIGSVFRSSVVAGVVAVALCGYALSARTATVGLVAVVVLTSPPVVGWFTSRRGKSRRDRAPWAGQSTPPQLPSPSEWSWRVPPDDDPAQTSTGGRDRGNAGNEPTGRGRRRRARRGKPDREVTRHKPGPSKTEHTSNTEHTEQGRRAKDDADKARTDSGSAHQNSEKSRAGNDWTSRERSGNDWTNSDRGSRDASDRPGVGMDARRLTDAELCLAWRRSFTSLQKAGTVRERLNVIAARVAYLDELERRDPAGFSRWLESNPRAAGNPSRFFTPGSNDQHEST
ncbi:hypothetical protein FB561_1964 [Kribbella amoyensis]|uniref:Uncharacterized protein n=1 Tax=Kribbella amoyensis TaxID=996641 RepID=A0A561BPU2_9ACTN|nr:hypothetical protein [Kribbella amoyensis]TWD80867.1 hypothetical protein FB561_1964 [Kribbella amoyensis]